MTVLQRLWLKTGEESDLYTDEEIRQIGKPFKLSVGSSLVGTPSSIIETDRTSDEGTLNPDNLNEFDPSSGEHEIFDISSGEETLIGVPKEKKQKQKDYCFR